MTFQYGGYARLENEEIKLSVSKKNLNDLMAAKEARRPLVLVSTEGWHSRMVEVDVITGTNP